MPIDRALIEEHLRLAEEHVRTGAAHIARQRQLIAELAQDGHDARAAEALLVQFEELQTLNLADRDRLVRELAEWE